MRKIIAILVGLMMLFSVSAFGEELDFSALSMDELIALRDLINREIESRVDVGGQLIGTGQYIVGEDIVEGKYEFVCTFVNHRESPSGGTGYNMGVISLYSNLSDDAEELRDLGDFEVGQLFMFELTPGNVLLIKDANFTVRPYSPEFAP